MARVGHGYDLGERSERWAGVISEVADIGGVWVHYLRTDAAGAPRDAPPHLLVHPLGAGSWSWIGRHRTPRRPRRGDRAGSARCRPRAVGRLNAGRAEHGACFLGELCETLDFDRIVLHGHSMGALVSALFAARQPERVARLVLTGPPLASRYTSPGMQIRKGPTA